MKRPCILLLTACLLGELLGYYLSMVWLGFGLTLTPAAALIIQKNLKNHKIKKSYIITFFFIFIIFIFRIKYEIYSMNNYTEKHLENTREFKTKIKNISFKGDNVIFSGEGVIVYLKQGEYKGDIYLGNIVNFKGEIERIKPGTNPGEFDTESYYKTKGIYYRMRGKNYSIINRSFNPVRQMFFIGRQYLGSAIDSIFKENTAGIIKAIILGMRQDLDKDVYKMYQKNGIAHLLAISGLHVSVLGIGLYKFLRKICHAKFSTSAIISSLSLLVYGMLVGEGVSIVRAAGMLIIYFIAEVYGRSYCLISALCISAAIICLISPFELFNVSFQLSFGAVLSLGAPITYILKKFKGCTKIFNTLTVSIGVQILTLPIILYYFYTFPLYAFILNILVIPLMSVVLYSSLISLFLYIFNIFLYKYICFIPSVILKLYTFLCEIVKLLPQHNVVFGRPEGFKIIFYYTYVFLIIALAVRIKKKCMLLLTIPSILILFPFFKRDEAVFLDVGQGDGIYMHIKDMDILIDGGSTSNKNFGEYTLEPFLLYKGVGDIEMSFISHSDIDHISGVLYILESDIKIKNIFLPYQAMEDASYDEIKLKAQAAGSNIKYISRGDSFENKNFKIDCLWPDKEEKEDVNEESEVLLMEIKGKRILFTGDIGKVSEESILNLGSIGRVDILKVAHHGSRYSSLEAFIEDTRPEYAIISYGEKNTYGHPGKETLETLNKYGCEIFETAKTGAIEVELR